MRCWIEKTESWRCSTVAAWSASRKDSEYRQASSSCSAWSSSGHFATSSVDSQRAVQEGGNDVKGIKDVFALIASTGMVAALLTLFFNWRSRLLSQIRAEHFEQWTTLKRKESNS
jgi:hypothetical protein